MRLRRQEGGGAGMSGASGGKPPEALRHGSNAARPVFAESLSESSSSSWPERPVDAGRGLATSQTQSTGAWPGWQGQGQGCLGANI